MISTVRAGQSTFPTVTDSGCTGCGGRVVVRVGAGVGGLVVALGDGERVGGAVVRVGAGEDRPVLPDGDGDGVGADVVAVGAPEARDSPVAFIRAGIAISAPMTKNTAAMTTLGNCIASSPARRRALGGARRPGGRWS
ncbi:hypothetical protein [Actinomadura hibisca]|uniref:hypothetical protein n=1 Tax=Actinomadura hibisca TaxID=68565 RepID=UPI000835BA10|nr:hypothetical protein [Actinomadura hibisca]